jgi:hypothetical protein
MKNLPLPLLLVLTLPGSLMAGNVLDKTGNPTATPVVAYSVRLLSSAYPGNCINVRRSSDGTSQDIGFTPAGDLDTATLKTFVGSGTGYVTTWYDQSGNGYNATQGTAAYQPTIMTAGQINRDNGQPSVYTSGGTGFLEYGPVSQLSGTTQVTRMEVCRSRDNSSLAITEGIGNYQLDLQLFQTNNIWVQFEDGNIVATTPVSNVQTLMSINSVRNSGASQLYVNTALLGTTTAGILPFSAPVLGYVGVRLDYVAGNSSGPGAFSETILFNSILSAADRQSINYNENWYYSLGFAPCSSTQDTLSANGTTTKALYACTLGTPSWAYYYDPAHPLNLLFGIEKDPGSTGANPSFVVDSVNLTTTSDPETSSLAYIAATDAIFAIGRYWNVYTHTPLTSPVNIRFFFNPADTMVAYNAALSFKRIFSLSSMSNLEWFKTIGYPFAYDSMTATPTASIKGPHVNLTPIYGTMNSITYAELDGVTSFSGGTGVYIVSNGMVTLPTIINPFTARRVDETTDLSWTTESESNTDHFEIERSANGNTWLTVGRVTAAGNSSTALSYQYTDAVSLQEGNSLHYRLRLVQKDGSAIYSTTVVVTGNNDATAAPELSGIAPNPFRNTLEITCNVPSGGTVEVLLQDITGATVIHGKYSAAAGVNTLTLSNLNELARGVYIVRVVQEGTGTVGIAKVIKE